jgi:thiaminase
MVKTCLLQRILSIVVREDEAFSSLSLSVDIFADIIIDRDISTVFLAYSLYLYSIVNHGDINNIAKKGYGYEYVSEYFSH